MMSPKKLANSDSPSSHTTIILFWSEPPSPLVKGRLSMCSKGPHQQPPLPTPPNIFRNFPHNLQQWDRYVYTITFFSAKANNIYKSHNCYESKHTLLEPSFMKGFFTSCLFVTELQIKQVSRMHQLKVKNCKKSLHIFTPWRVRTPTLPPKNHPKPWPHQPPPCRRIKWMTFWMIRVNLKRYSKAFLTKKKNKIKFPMT